MPGSEPWYAPGKLTVAGALVPPPVICSCAHSIYHPKRLSVSVNANNIITYIELSAGVRACGVQCDDLVAEKILPCSDATGECERHFSLICDHTVDTPFSRAV